MAEATRNAVENLIKSGVVYFGCGGAVGYDTLAAQTVLSLRDGLYAHIKLIQVLPFRGMESKWSREQQVVFNEINGQADKVVWLSDRYTGNELYHIRNRYLVDNAAYLIAYCRDINARSGTASCYRYAMKQNTKIVHLRDG